MEKPPVEERLVQDELVRRIDALYSWAQDTHRLVPEIKLERGINPTAINRIITEGYDSIDRVIGEYEEALKKGYVPSSEKYSIAKVHDAGISCYNELSQRFDELCEEAWKLGLLNQAQKELIERENNLFLSTEDTEEIS